MRDEGSPPWRAGWEEEDAMIDERTLFIRGIIEEMQMQECAAGYIYVGLSVVISNSKQDGVVTFITLCWQFGIIARWPTGYSKTGSSPPKNTNTGKVVS